MLTTGDIDELCEFVLSRLMAEGGSAEAVAEALVARLAVAHPEIDALTPILPLSLAAVALDEMLAGTEARAQADGAWRMAALIGAEVLALQAESRLQSTTKGQTATAPAAPCMQALWRRMQRKPGQGDEVRSGACARPELSGP